MIQFADGFTQFSSVLFRMFPGMRLNWSYAYSPADNGRLTVNFDDGVASATGSINVDVSRRMLGGAAFDAFGLVRTSQRTNDADVAELYIDDVQYTVLPEPLKVKAVEILASTIRITFSTPLPEARHELEQIAALGQGTWAPVSGVTFSASGGDMTAEFSKPTGEARFYRLSIIP